MNGGIKMGEKNYQSVSNYSYNRRRNTPPETPAQNGNPSVSDRNSSNNTSSSMYNSYVSENDYNSYTSSYQPPQNSFNNSYNQPPQNSFNNGYNQPPQNDFYNSYDQQQQNGMPTYQGYNFPMPQSYSGGHHAIEVPLSKKFKKSDAVMLLAFGIPFALTLISLLLSSGSGMKSGFMSIVIPILMFCSFAGLVGGIIASAIIEDKRLKSVCTVPVTGHLAGYVSHIRHTKHSHYRVYAPKYEIFINNRYEIRTLDNFTRNQNFAQQLNLLANPNGYEIIRASAARR